MRAGQLLRNTSVVAAGSMAAALTGLGLRSVIAYRYGASDATDALVASIQTAESFALPLVPILSATFIPMFASAAMRSTDEARLVARTILVLAGGAFLLLA